MENLQVEGLKHSLSSLIPGIRIAESRVAVKDFARPRQKPTKQVRQECGFFVEDGRAVLYFRNRNKFVLLTLRRDRVPLTKRELELFRPFSKIMAPLLVSGRHRLTQSIERIASYHTLEHLLVAASMRGGAARLTTVALPAFAISQLQRLSEVKYEGHPCTSGFLFTKSAQRFLEGQQPAGIEIEKFRFSVPLTQQFFRFPASYRYVDGKNAFYVLGRDWEVHAIARVRYPRNFDFLDRSNNEHLATLLRDPEVPWVAYVGLNSDVNVVKTNFTQFRLVRSHWRYSDSDQVRAMLEEFDVLEPVARTLVRLMFSLSDLRTGALVLIPYDLDALPSVAGQIDESPLGKQLHSTVAGASIVDLAKSGRAIGVLASDGLTVVTRDGTVTAAGQIVDLVHRTKDSLSGGGRTQAALATSKFGISIKVSEDGPISIFTDTSELLRIER